MSETPGSAVTNPVPGSQHVLVLTPQTSRAVLALHDIVVGFTGVTLWWTMAWTDIRMRYRRSVLGPFWLTISMGISVLVMGFLYSVLFKLDAHEYVPHLTLGLIAWSLVQGVVIEGCTGFILSEHFIKQIRLPYSTFVYRLICRNVIIAAHNAVVYIGVAIWFEITPSWNMLLFIPGLALVLLNSVWVAMLLGMICTRFRDVPQLVTSLLQVVFFVTPIMWVPKLLGGRASFVNYNPGFHVVELIRAPLLGESPTAMNWLFILVMTVVGWLITFVMFRHYRNRIAFWL
jgi:lipopolysaccharide transport system permease protein